MSSSKKVIIVDDDTDLLRLLISAFKSKGFETKTFTNGKEALAYLLDTKNLEDACLIILDRLLPDMDGLDIFRKCCHHSKLVPVLFLSQLSSEKDMTEGLKLGAVDYITKPFSLQVLIQKAMTLMKQ